MSIPTPPVAPRALVSLHLSPPTTPATQSNSSTDMIGRGAPSRFVKTALQVQDLAWVVAALAVGLVAVAVSVVAVEASPAVVALAVVVSEEALAVVTVVPPLGLASSPVPRCPPTLSPTSLHPEVKRAM